MSEKKKIKISIVVVTDGSQYAAYGASAVSVNEAWEKLEYDEWGPDITTDCVSVVEAEIEYEPNMIRKAVGKANVETPTRSERTK